MEKQHHELTDEDRAIFFRHLGETASVAMRAEFREDGDLTNDQIVMRKLLRYPRSAVVIRAYADDMFRMPPWGAA
jgi:Cu/Zn superoxide dismutase